MCDVSLCSFQINAMHDWNSIDRCEKCLPETFQMSDLWIQMLKINKKLIFNAQSNDEKTHGQTLR